MRNRVYYQIKPLLPSRLRRVLRRWLVRRIRPRVTATWPILPGSEKAPPDWPGWPDGKKFAVVLTHDVEGTSGVAKCRQLMASEAKLGFRSSFNFIPEGPYQVAKDLRDELTANGFEVGVHDLHHDGKLYHSRQEFGRKAERINRYLKEWGATGFRSGFMLHNLEWAQQLNVLYEASTFDTDPFEPQPEGVGTIFPFWVPRPDSRDAVRKPDLGLPNQAERRGYVGLPYTLVQDSTLFLLLGERSPDIWFEKVNWIAKHGGMVLLITHPDYMSFQGVQNGHEYPIQFYERLLEFLRSNYGDVYWHALPREVARYWHRAMPLRPETREPTIVTI